MGVILALSGRKWGSGQEIGALLRVSERNREFCPKGIDVSTPKLPSDYYSSCVVSFPKMKVGKGELPGEIP